jgi:hypothetical protein
MLRPLATLVLLTFIFCTLSAQDEAFTVVRKDEKITLYERWTNFPESKVLSRQIKGEFIVSGTLEKIFLAITDEGRVKEWQKNIIEYKHIHGNDSMWHTYSLYEIPWPLTNQDYFLQFFLTEKTENRIILTFKPSTNEKIAPLRTGVDRKPTIGSWTIEKMSGGKIKVTYIATSKPVGYPRLVTDRIVRNNFMNTFNAFIATAEKK